MVNKWASWCDPCRAEFPAFQQVATERGQARSRSSASTPATARSRRAASSAQYPVPFPSYVDPDEKIARAIKAPANYPITVFVDAHGQDGVHPPGRLQLAEQELEADIDRYLGA